MGRVMQHMTSSSLEKKDTHQWSYQQRGGGTVSRESSANELKRSREFCWVCDMLKRDESSCGLHDRHFLFCCVSSSPRYSEVGPAQWFQSRHHLLQLCLNLKLCSHLLPDQSTSSDILHAIETDFWRARGNLLQRTHVKSFCLPSFWGSNRFHHAWHGHGEEEGICERDERICPHYLNRNRSTDPLRFYLVASL